MNGTERHERQLEAAQFISMIQPTPESVVEIRALQCPERHGQKFKSTFSGYFIDPMEAAKAAIRCDELGAAGTYITLNEVNPQVRARSADRMTFKAKSTTADADILRRRWIVIDIDPKRPSGISATDAEKRKSFEAREAVEAYLCENGFPSGVKADSGNGYYLLYPIDLEPSDTRVAELLSHLADRFDSEHVSIDRTVASIARIIKVPGTTARKGSDLVEGNVETDRPWRVSSWDVETSSEDGFVVDTSVLDGLVGTRVEEGEFGDDILDSLQFQHEFDINEFVDRHFPDALKKAKPNGDTVWIPSGVPCCDHGSDGPFIRKCADGVIQAGCHHNSCDWKWQDLREALDPGCYDNVQKQGDLDIITINIDDLDFSASQEMVDAIGEERSKLDPWRLAWQVAAILGNGKVEHTVSFRGSMFRYSEISGRYQEIDSTKLGIVIRTHVGTMAQIHYQDLLKGWEKAGSKGRPPAKPNIARRLITDVRDNLIDIRKAFADPSTEPPFLIESGEPVRLAPFANAWVDIEGGSVSEPTPRIFVRDVIPCKWDPDAKCPLWEKSLKMYWPDDQDSIDLLQEWFGYVLSGRTDLQKCVYVQGPPSSGKGVIADVLALMSPATTFLDNRAVSSRFGPGSLLGSHLNICRDLRSQNKDNAGLLDRILSIVGCDPIAVDVKNKAMLPSVVLNTRMAMFSNEPLITNDPSSAVARRVLYLKMERSTQDSRDFDPKISEKLQKEHAGIVQWAYEGYKRLVLAGDKFTRPKSAESLYEGLKRNGSPVADFFDHCLIVDPESRVTSAELVSAWEARQLEDGQSERPPRRLLAEIEKLRESMLGGVVMKKMKDGEGRVVNGLTNLRLRTPQEQGC